MYKTNSSTQKAYAMQMRLLSLSTLILSFCLLVLGVVIHRSTGGTSELSLIQRLIAALVFAGTLALSLNYFKKESTLYQEIDKKKKLSLLAFLLVILQGFIGYLNVRYELPSIIMITHLLISIGFFSILVNLDLNIKGTLIGQVELKKESVQVLPYLRDLTNLLLFLWFFQIFLGAVIRYSGYGLACGLSESITFKCLNPQVSGELIWPNTQASQLNWLHRATGGVILLLSLGTLPLIFQTFKKKTNLITFTPLILLALTFVQAFLGFLSIKSILSLTPTSLHLGIGLIGLALYHWLSFSFRELENRHFKGKAKTKLRDYLELTKPRLGLLVMATALIGLVLTNEPVHFFYAFLGLILVALVVMGATTLNCYMEKDVDSLMERTKDRALPAGRLHSKEALIFGCLLFGLSLPTLYFLINPITSYLAFLAAILYLLAYTPMKKMSPLAVYVGAIPGAIPPVLGHTIVTGEMDAFAWFLFAFLFIWQIPHFMAISIYHASDYKKAEILVYGNSWSFKGLSWAIFLYTLLLAIVSYIPLHLGQVAIEYRYVASTLNLIFGLLSFWGFFFIDNDVAQKKWARSYFIGSIVYLPVLLGALVILKVV